MILELNKIKTKILFIVCLTSIVLMAVTYWNFIKIEPKHNYLAVLSFIFLVLAIGSVSWFYIIYLKETNVEMLNQKINQTIEEERSKILAEFSKKDEVVEEEQKIDYEDIINKILPKGNFKNVNSFVTKLLQNLAPEIEMAQAVFYNYNKEDESYEFVCGYATTNDEIPGFKKGENLNGQVAETKEMMILNDIPDEYMTIESGLGKSQPVHLIIVPVLSQDECIAIIEIATFKSNTEYSSEILNKLVNPVSEKLVQMIKS